jgi:hypothetical protein
MRVRLNMRHMPRSDQPHTDDQYVFHITAPICQGTNS